MSTWKRTLSLLCAAFLLAAAASAQIQVNRLCQHNGGDYYLAGVSHSSPNAGGGKYFPGFSHWAARGVKVSGGGWTYPWKIRGWAWAGMMASVYGPLWVWEGALQRSVDNPWSTNMTWDYPLNYCTGIVSHTGAPQPLYGAAVPPGLPSVGGQDYVYPSSYGGISSNLNIFAVAATTWNIPSTLPYYGWEFGFVAPSKIEIPSNTSIYEFAWENQGPFGQYLLLSGDELDCTGLLPGNKGKSYSVWQDGGGSGTFYYFNNPCTGVPTEWAMCLLVDDPVAIPVNVSPAASGPFAPFGFDVGVATVTPNAQSGSCQLQVMTEDYATPGGARVLLAGSPWIGLTPYGAPAPCVPYGKMGWRLPHGYDSVTALFQSLSFVWYHVLSPGFPAAMLGTTTGGYSIGVPLPPDPTLKCLELRFCSFSAAGGPPSASYMVTYF